MLVLGRRKQQSVLIGDEITLTVEEICDAGDGRPVVGATVRLGFQVPREVAICRSELRAERSGAVRAGKAARPPRPREEKRVGLADAQVRLRIEVPRKVPVCHNGTRTVGFDAQETIEGGKGSSTAVHLVTCQENDQIVICNNVAIAAVGFHRVVREAQPATG
jgi:carbon storage regulator CsrA